MRHGDHVKIVSLEQNERDLPSSFRLLTRVRPEAR
jgi:hypothetical protein